MYRIDEIYAPYEMDQDQEWWLGIISRDGAYGCVEIREDNEQDLLNRLQAVVDSLNGTDNSSNSTKTTDDDLDRAMRGI